MPALSNHTSAQTTKLLFVGDTGCLSADTIVSVRRGTKPHKMTLESLYKRFNGKHHNRNSEAITEILADLGGWVGHALVLAVIKSGKKKLYKVCTDNKIIRASEDHQFSTPEGWKKLSELAIGDEVFVWQGTRELEFNPVKHKSENAKKRVWCYSIPYHPFGQANIVAGRDYKRLPRARLVLEAAMNGISLSELISILRNDAETAATLQYTSNALDVHHLNGDVADDRPENLILKDRAEHMSDHAPDRERKRRPITRQQILSIEEGEVEETYDLKIEAPYHNFVANGFVVHNSGKSGALASLAQAGYNLRILDFDNGLDILANLLKQGVYGPEALQRVCYQTLTDPMVNKNGRLVPKSPTVWRRTIEQLMNWKTDSEELGSILTWTPQDVLVIDSLTFLARAAMDNIMQMNARLGGRAEQSDWFQAQQLLEGLLQTLYDENVKCNVIMNTHITYIGAEGGPVHGYPNSLGKALSPKIGRYFNSVLMAKTSGQGTNQKRKILTGTTGVVELKNTNPKKVKPEYALESGLAEYFRDVREGA